MELDALRLWLCGVNHNNGHETHQRNIQMAIQGLSGTKMNSGPFLAMLFKYSLDYSEESYWRFFDSDEGLSTFKSIAVPAKADFDRVQNLHQKTLVSIFSNGSSKVSPHFHLAMQKVSELGDPGKPLYLKIRMAHSEQMKLFNNGSLYSGAEYIIPTQNC